ncbi:MAG: UDP-N-acetylglucosamine 2-epimerase [Flavobacterium sp.]|jgi:UDP-hydrolysing UDP-N-acetyl-D-glucosamine 2-epimerase|uniref:UDP-N-acetylglucosamine 2-epimerase n=1 Tax=Flavobacterium TaxID=237 RepID=UPI000DB2D6AF|nr:UDP-N-acetylglucosamine 2-epimerase [Flavobacterium sp.]MCZ8091057.1 UDP-N-acetylglucosamine 2-epimerase [Flavobacterium sp.]MCZ8330773.1 UDP-N-acetylglucosamine 2-epimerase [Flavobacterium sp.]PZO26543.1 MAG: UDP-N-acetylglucosamine 2-epimerase (hydrolyzing) [Flavobacteriaceae bacterium]
MNVKRKIAVVITARPSYSRVKTVLTAIQNHPELELQLIVAASALLDRYGSAVNYIVNDGFEIAAKVFNVLEGENLTAAAKTTGIGILELSTVFDNLKPDIVVTVADRFETMATAISASYMNIPLAHIQGGEVTGNIDEKVRHSITKLADYHFVASENAKQRVIQLGENPEMVFNTGCPSIDIASQVNNKTNLDFNPYERYGGVGSQPNLKNGYLVVMQHPVTNEYKDSRKHIEATLTAIQKINKPTLWFWPNVDAGADGTSSGIRSFREKYELENVHFFKNMKGDDFLTLLNHSLCLIGNSSVGIRECAYLGVPTVNIGSRQNRRDRGKNVIDVSYNEDDIVNAVEIILKENKREKSTVYGGGNAGEKIAKLLSSLPLKFHKTITY